MATFFAMKVPDEARKGNEDNFVPCYVSIGPLHARKNPKFEAMEDIKTEYLRSFLEGADPDKDKLTEQKICALLSTKAPIWRASYFYEGVSASPMEDFTQMLMRDGCFIIEFLLMQTKEHPNRFTQICPTYQIETAAILKDLLLLENQLPWEVLELLYSNSNICKKTKISLENLAFTSFQRHTPCKHTRLPSPPGTGKNDSSSIAKLHLLDCFRHYLLGSKLCNIDIDSRPLDPKLLNVPSVAELADVKVKFTGISRSAYMADITFLDQQGEVKIPQICVDTYTEHLFRNLLAFERGDPNVQSLFTSYIVLLKYLIKTKNDAEHLLEKNALLYYTSSENLVSFFDSLYIDISFSSILYTGLRRNLNKFYSARWNKWHAALIRNYCNTPWMIIATVGAFVIAGLTLVQTIYTILGYHEP